MVSRLEAHARTIRDLRLLAVLLRSERPSRVLAERERWADLALDAAAALSCRRVSDAEVELVLDQVREVAR